MAVMRTYRARCPCAAYYVMLYGRTGKIGLREIGDDPEVGQALSIGAPRLTHLASPFNRLNRPNRMRWSCKA
jgi:hypothetical protein